MVIKGQAVDNLVWGDTLTDDGHLGKTFDYGLSNPPFGVEWKKQQAFVTAEHEQRGYEGRFAPGLPRVSDGSLLFLLHLIKKMRPKAQGGGRVGIVLNGSPLFTGGAGSGESNIRKYLLENDLLDAIVALPTDLFYNTGIATYIWILDNDKPTTRRGTVQLIDATDQWTKMRKSLGAKRREISPEQIEQIVRLYVDHDAARDASKVFKTTDFGYTTITVERPLQLNWALTEDRLETALASRTLAKFEPEERERLIDALLGDADATALVEPSFDEKTFTKAIKQLLNKAGLALAAAQVKALIAGLSVRDEAAPVVYDTKGGVVPDADLRDTENVPLNEDIDDYVAREVAPHVERFWIDRVKDKVGYEIPFTRHFYKYVPPRSLEEIDADLNRLVQEITGLLTEVEQA